MPPRGRRWPCCPPPAWRRRAALCAVALVASCLLALSLVSTTSPRTDRPPPKPHAQGQRTPVRAAGAAGGTPPARGGSWWARERDPGLRAVRAGHAAGRGGPHRFGHAECAAAVRRWYGTASPRKTLRSVVWMHFPKAGSSLGILLHNYLCRDDGTGRDDDDDKVNAVGFRVECACEQKNQTMWDHVLKAHGVRLRHQTCEPNMTTAGLFASHNTAAWSTPAKFARHAGGLVAMFREPRRRLVSAYHHGKHAWGLPKADQPALAGVVSLRGFVGFPGVAGCQTKMMAGRFCAAPAAPDRELELELALQRLPQLAFVGLTERWNASVCLFHMMWGGVVHPNEFANVRPGAASDGLEEAARLPRNVDPLDDRLYSAARALFEARLQHYGLTP